MSNKNFYEESPLFLKDFLFYLETIMGRSYTTVYEYYIDIRTFIRYIMISKKMVNKDLSFNQISIRNTEIPLISSITLSDLYDYMHYLSHERNNSNKTRARKISSLKTFYKYLSTKTNLIISNPLEKLESPSIKKSIPKHLTLEESLSILENIDGLNKQRDYCIFTIFLNCGLRLSELVGININDIKTDSLKVLGKGNKERIVYLNQACLNAIEDYLPLRDQIKSNSNALFISRKRNRISRRRVQQIVEYNLKNSGLNGYSTHKLRHTAATLMFQHGNVDIRVLKDVLGHSNISTTELYTHVSNKQLEEASRKSPLSNIKINKK